MRVVVTGAAGFVGSTLCHALLTDGTPVVGLDRVGPSAGDRLGRAWTALAARPGFVPVRADLADPSLDLAARLAGADVVVHLAGRAGTDESWSAYDDYLRDNVASTARLARACLHAGVRRLVHVSSSSVYGAVAAGDERQPLQPSSPYGVSKLAAESTLQAYAGAHGLPFVVVRPFSVYGPGQRPDMGVYRLVAAALHGTEFPVHGDGSQTRSMTYVDDLVGALRAALAGGPDGAVYNVGGATCVSVLELLDEVTRLCGSAPRVRHVADRPGNQRHTAADTTAAALTLGWAPKVGVSEGLRRQVDWQRAVAPPR